MRLDDILLRQPLVPFIRESDYAVRRPWHFGTRRLLDYLLIYVQEGTCRVAHNEVIHELNAGEFCLIQPNDLCELEGVTATITPFAHFDLFFNPDRDKSFPTLPGQTNLDRWRGLMQPKLNDVEGIHIPFRIAPVHPSRFRETLLKLIGLWQSGDLFNRMQAHHLLAELALALLEQYGRFSSNADDHPRSLNWITAYFAHHLSEPLRLREMARRAHLSPSRFSAVFKQKFGISPYAYLLRLRVQHAQELLRNSGYSLQDISGLCGFADVHHFSKTFKRLTGETPGSRRPDRT